MAAHQRLDAPDPLLDSTGQPRPRPLDSPTQSGSSRPVARGAPRSVARLRPVRTAGHRGVPAGSSSSAIEPELALPPGALPSPSNAVVGLGGSRARAKGKSKGKARGGRTYAVGGDGGESKGSALHMEGSEEKGTAKVAPYVYRVAPTTHTRGPPDVRVPLPRLFPTLPPWRTRSTYLQCLVPGLPLMQRR